MSRYVAFESQAKCALHSVNSFALPLTPQKQKPMRPRADFTDGRELMACDIIDCANIDKQSASAQNSVKLNGIMCIFSGENTRDTSTAHSQFTYSKFESIGIPCDAKSDGNWIFVASCRFGSSQVCLDIYCSRSVRIRRSHPFTLNDWNALPIF